MSTDIYIHPSSYRDENVDIGHGTKIWHFCHIMSEVIIGQNCSIGQNVFIGKGVKIGNNVKIQNNVSVYSGVIIEDDVFLGPSMVFTNVINPRSAINRSKEFKTTIVRKGCSIGANATVVCGIELGKSSFVGAGAVVSKSIKDYALVMGVPARHSAWISQAGLKLNFNNGTATCPEDNSIYTLENGIVQKIESID